MLGSISSRWTLQLRQVHLRYQDLPHRNTTFKIDDSTFTENGFTCPDVYPTKFAGNTFTLNNTNSLCNKIYSNSLTNHHFAMGLGQSFDKDWIHVISNESIPRLNTLQCWSECQSMHNT